MGQEGQSDPSKDLPRTDIAKNIPVSEFINRYHVVSPETQEALRSFPTLCYLLGNITENPQLEDASPDGVKRPVYLLTEGSGMFGLKKPEDAMRWSGIFNHIMGTARQVRFLSELLRNLSEEQKQQFAEKGFNHTSFDEIDPEILQDFMFISHAGRRQMDEYNWHKLQDKAHLSGDSYKNTVALLISNNAPQALIDLMRIEDHDIHLVVAAKDKILPNIVDNILTYADWTYGQQPQPIKDRFKGLRASKRASTETLDILEGIGENFESAFKDIVGVEILGEMPKAKYEWEEKIRRAYCSPSGLSLQEAFPAYTLQFGIKD